MTEAQKKIGRPRIENPSTPQQRTAKYNAKLKAGGGTAVTFRIADGEQVRKLDKYAEQRNLSRSAAVKLLFCRVLDLIE